MYTHVPNAATDAEAVRKKGGDADAVDFEVHRDCGGEISEGKWERGEEDEEFLCHRRLDHRFPRGHVGKGGILGTE